LILTKSYDYLKIQNVTFTTREKTHIGEDQKFDLGLYPIRIDNRASPTMINLERYFIESPIKNPKNYGNQRIPYLKPSKVGTIRW
jgi:hypothetical protein